MAWFDDEEVYRPRSYDYRRKSKKWIWIIFIILIIFGIFYAYDILGVKTSITKITKETTNSSLFSNNALSNSFSYTSIKDLAQNPENYVGKKVSINGELSPSPINYGEYRLWDKNGYFIYITGNCLEQNRVYDYSNSEYTATKYIAIGIITSDGKLDCTSPIK